MKNNTKILVLILLLILISSSASAFDKSEAETLLRRASAVAFYGGPFYTLVQIYELSPTVEVIPSLDAQKEKYPQAQRYVQSEAGAYGECTYLTADEYRFILGYFFDENLADDLFNKSMGYKARCKDGGLKLRVIDGLLYDFGVYGDPPGAYFIETDFETVTDGKAILTLKYRPDSPPSLSLEDEYEYEIMDYEFVLEKGSDGIWRFTKFTSVNDNAAVSVYPELRDLYNPHTSDSPVYLIAVALLSLLCAVVCAKKRRAVG